MANSLAAFLVIFWHTVQFLADLFRFPHNVAMQ